MIGLIISLSIGIVLMIYSSISINLTNKVKAKATVSDSEASALKNLSIITLLISIGLVLYAIYGFIPESMKSSVKSKLGM